MSLNPFSFVVVLVILAIFFKDYNKRLEVFFKHIFLLNVYLSIFLNVGWFFKLGSTELGYSFLPSTILIVVGIICLIADKKYDKKLLLFGVLFILGVVLGILFFFVTPYRGGIIQNSWDEYVMGNEELTYDPVIDINFMSLFSIVRYPIILSIAFAIFKKEDWISAHRQVMSLSTIVIVYGFIELLCKSVLNLNMTRLFLNPIFGEAFPTYALTERMQGLFKEPSHYSLGLYLLALLCLLRIRVLSQGSRRKYRLEHVRLVCILFLMLASTSFSSLIYLAAVVVLYPFICRGVRASVIIFFSAIVLALALMVGTNQWLMSTMGLGSYYERINRAIHSVASLMSGNMATGSSEGARFSSIFSMISILFHRPLFGIGMGVTDAHSTVFAVLGNFGLVGFGLWVAMLVRFGNIKKCGGFFVFTVLVSMMFAGGVGFFTLMEYPFIFAIAGYSLSYPIKKAAPATEQVGTNVTSQIGDTP